jgi:hypothetical protein
MIALVLAVITYCRAFFVGRQRLGLEVASLRQQLVVFKRERSRPHLCDLDRAFWLALRPCGRVGECPDHRKARYRDCLASCGVSPVLAMAIAA